MPKPRFLRTVWLGCVAAVLVLAAVGTSASGSPAAKPRWYELPNLEIGHGRALTDVAWAGGRAWFVVGSSKKLTMVSARVRGNALASFKTTDIQAPGLWYPIVLGSDVLYSTTRTSTGIAPLLASGKVGPGEAPSPDPVASVAAEVGVPVAAVRLGGRAVWALAGGRQTSPGSLSYKPTLWVCCDDTGAPRNLSSLITASVRRPPLGHAFGVDGRGRLWLAWIDGRTEARIVQLDPTTLAPLTRKALVAPVARPGYSGTGRPTDEVDLACAATCRLVLTKFYPLPSGGGGTRIVTWAPGERSATTVDLGPGPDNTHPNLVAADNRGSRLAVVYYDWLPSSDVILKVVVGDARGNRARPAGSITVPAISRGRQPWFSAGAFVPSGYVHAQMYSKWGLRGHVVAAVVPLK